MDLDWTVSPGEPYLQTWPDGFSVPDLKHFFHKILLHFHRHFLSTSKSQKILNRW